mgnify:CR=1 FL=1
MKILLIVAIAIIVFSVANYEKISYFTLYDYNFYDRL